MDREANPHGTKSYAGLGEVKYPRIKGSMLKTAFEAGLAVVNKELKQWRVSGELKPILKLIEGESKTKVLVEIVPDDHGIAGLDLDEVVSG